MTTSSRSIPRAGIHRGWPAATLAVLGCCVAFAIGVVAAPVMPMIPQLAAPILVAAAVYALIDSASRRPLREDGPRQAAVASTGLILSLAAPVVLMAFGGLVQSSQMGDALLIAFLVLQAAVYLASAGWFAWHARWVPVAVLIGAAIPLPMLMLIALLSPGFNRMAL